MSFQRDLEISVPELGLVAATRGMLGAGLGLLLGMKGERKPIAFVEDCAVEPSKLPAFFVRFRDVIHKYKGTIQTNLRPRPYKGMINIQKIDPTTGRVSGLVSIPFLVQNFKFALHGTVRPDGSYTFSFKRPAVSAKLTGQYTAGQHLVGNFSGNGLGRSITGTMDFHKI